MKNATEKTPKEQEYDTSTCSEMTELVLQE